MVEGGGGFGFRHEAAPPVRVGDPIRGEDFDRHLAVEPGIPRAIHLTHAAFAQLGLDAIRAE